MDIGVVDRSAASQSGWLHRARPVSKLLAFVLVLGAVIASWNVFCVLALMIMLVAVLVLGNVRLRPALTLAAYPGVFALIFAFASAPDVLTASVIVLKAVCAGLAAVTVMMTTPYPQVFAPVQRVVPGIVGDALLMTYRSTFLLLGKFDRLLRAVRLRAGIRGRHPIKSAKATVQALGALLLYSFDLAQRDYDIMRIRGYAGRLRTKPPRGTGWMLDAWLLAGGVLVLIVALAWRLDAAALNPYSWMLPIVPLALLAISALVSHRRKS
ncbi:MAG: energy-coupling factor transporter transmembrane component T family protein [Coriobacteriia bacterium]